MEGRVDHAPPQRPPAGGRHRRRRAPQYLYHPQWRASRDAAKFDRILGFGKALSKARERVLTDIGAEGMSQERACAVAVRLLDLGYFRIGNDVYTDTNGSFGLTTLRSEHVSRRGSGCGSASSGSPASSTTSTSTTRPRSRHST